MNKIDGGNRKFILCTNNQNNICRNITYERIRKVIEGYKYTGKKERVLYEKKLTLNHLKNMNKILDEIKSIEETRSDDFDRISKSLRDGVLKVLGVDTYEEEAIGLGGNLKYYKTEYIDKCIEERTSLTEELINYIEPLIQLENGVRLDDEFVKVIYDDESADEFINSEENLINCKKIYISDDVLLTTEQEYLLCKYNIKVTDIPKYYFIDEIKEEVGLCMI